MNKKRKFLSLLVTVLLWSAPGQARQLPSPSLQGYDFVVHANQKTVSACSMRFFHASGKQGTWLDGSVSLLLRPDGLIYGVFMLAARNVAPGSKAPPVSIPVDYAWLRFGNGVLLEPLETVQTDDANVYATTLAFENGVDLLMAFGKSTFTLGFHTPREAREQVVRFNEAYDWDRARKMHECLHLLIDEANMRLGG